MKKKNTNHTHVTRRGTPQNFLLAFIDELWKTQNIRILKNEKNLLEISSFYTWVPKTTITWGTVHEIQSETFFCHFGPFVYHKWRSYDIWFLRYQAGQAIFCPFTSLTIQKIKILKKWKKHLAILSLYTSIINQNHMMYDSWDMEQDGQNFSHFGPFYPVALPRLLTTQRIKILKNEKRPLQISPFYTSVPQMTIIWYTVPEIWHLTDVIVIFHFGLFFDFLPP